MGGIYCAATSSAISFNTRPIYYLRTILTICSIIALSGSRVCCSVGLNIVITGSPSCFLLVVFIKAVSADISEMPLVEILEGQIDNSGVSKGVNIR